MSGHTPGPWVAYEATERVPLPIGVPVAVGTKAGGGSIATIVCEMVAQGEGGEYLRNTTNANALLIAAAPELLAFAKRIGETPIPETAWDWLTSSGLDMVRRAAIAKAEGSDE